jgi:CRP-like cAMP-binding protein
LRSTILAHARWCELERKSVLVRSGKAPANLVFLTAGMASLVISMSSGSLPEVGMLGNQGISGCSTLIGPDTNHPDCIVQITGRGLQVPRLFLQDLFFSSSEFQGKILQVLQKQINISARLSACNLRHEAKARFSRWLLTASDLTDSPSIEVTQQFLSEMLGTRRTTISAVVQPLRAKGLISVTRGTIHILDRPGLRNAACECYDICRRCIPPPPVATLGEPVTYRAEATA